MIALADLKNMSVREIKTHIASNYGAENYDNPLDLNVYKCIKPLTILIAYESVGSWGCDSSSFFLFKDKKTDKLYELHGSHCSCFGFENQFKLEEVTKEAMEVRLKEGYNPSLFYTGGYDNDADENIGKVNIWLHKTGYISFIPKKQ